MHRRTLLATVGGGTLALAGCLSTASGDDAAAETPPDAENRRYEECSREVIPYDMFPAEIQAEIDAAIEDGYEADRVFLEEAMNTSESYVSVGDTYYEASVRLEGSRERLALQAVEPKALPNPRSVSVEQTRDGERTISVTLTADDGTVLVDETRTLHPGGDVEFGSMRRVGTHELHVTVSNDGELEDEFVESVSITESQFDILVQVDQGEISITGAVADLAACRYDPTE